MQKIIVAVGVSLLTGLAVGAWLAGDDEPELDADGRAKSELNDDASVEERVAHLEEILRQEREARIALEDTLAMVFEDLERLEATGERGAETARSAEREREERRAAEASRNRRGDADWLTRYRDRRIGRLVEGGFTEDEARRTLELESQVAFKALQSSWEAQRNGESFDPFAASSDPQALMRQQLGDASFERYLEAQGQPTTIGVTQVYAGSPGSEAGMQPGDRVVSYDGERVYSMSDLRRQTMQGAPGETVIIEVERDGMRIQLSVPRGPIDMTGNGARVRGMNWWGG